MKIITTRLRGYFDYTIGLSLILTPWIFSFSNDKPSSYLLIIPGMVALIQSIATDYECGIIKQVSMKRHLQTDLFIGIFLVVAPFIFQLTIYRPYLFFGLVKIILRLISQSIPSYKGYHGYTYKKFENTYRKFEKLIYLPHTYFITRYLLK